MLCLQQCTGEVLQRKLFQLPSKNCISHEVMKMMAMTLLKDVMFWYGFFFKISCWQEVLKCWRLSHLKRILFSVTNRQSLVNYCTSSLKPMVSICFVFPFSACKWPPFIPRNCQRAFLMVSRTLRSQSNALEEIQSALGETCVGIWDGMPAHTPRNAVLEAAKEVVWGNKKGKEIKWQAADLQGMFFFLRWLR